MTGHPDTSVDGCGVLPDRPIGRGTRIRFQLTDDRQQDVTVHVANGVLHVHGMYRPLLISPVQAHEVAIGTARW